MSRLEDGREVPSVIKKIVIYDKPNKPYVSCEILSRRSRRYPAGDIVLSQSKKDHQEGPLGGQFENDVEIKSEPDDYEDDGELEEEEQENLEQPTEIGEETANENASDLEESIENISKEISKIEPKRLTDTVEKPLVLRTYSRKKAQGVEKVEKPQQQTKQSTILNFLIKPVDQKVSLEANSGSSSEVDDSPPKSKNPPNASGKYSVTEGRQKRTRRVPKKYQDNLNEDDTLPSPKKKKYTELKAVPYPGLEEADESANSDTFEDVLSDAEQINKAKNSNVHEASDEEQAIKLEDVDEEFGDKVQEEGNNFWGGGFLNVMLTCVL